MEHAIITNAAAAPASSRSSSRFEVLHVRKCPGIEYLRAIRRKELQGQIVRRQKPVKIRDSQTWQLHGRRGSEERRAPLKQAPLDDWRPHW